MTNSVKNSLQHKKRNLLSTHFTILIFQAKSWMKVQKKENSVAFWLETFGTRPRRACCSSQGLIREELKASPCCSGGPEILALDRTIWIRMNDKVKPPTCICLAGPINIRARTQAASWAPSAFFLGGVDHSKVSLPMKTVRQAFLCRILQRVQL